MKKIETKKLQDRITIDDLFNCSGIRCKDCIFLLIDHSCGGTKRDLNFNKIKNTKFRLKELTITNLKRFLIINKSSQYEK